MNGEHIQKLKAELAALEAKLRFVNSLLETEERLPSKIKDFSAYANAIKERIEINRNIYIIKSELSGEKTFEKKNINKPGPSKEY